MITAYLNALGQFGSRPDCSQILSLVLDQTLVVNFGLSGKFGFRLWFLAKGKATRCSPRESEGV